MRKSVVISILVIYIASIFFIGFFGMQLGSFGTKYVERIECQNEELIVRDDGSMSIILDYEDWQYGYQLVWKVFPEDADDRSVSFFCDNENIATVSNRGRVDFLTNGTVYITIRPNDRIKPELEQTIRIIALRQ